MPMTRGRVWARLKVTTTSRTRPTWSPSGSKTLSSVRRPTKARVGVLTGTGYRGRGARPGHLAGAVTAGCCGGRRPDRASATAASRWSPYDPGPSTSRPCGVSRWMVHDCRHRSAVSPTALRRSGRSTSTAASHSASSGVTSRTVACTVTRRPPVSLLRRISSTSSGSQGSGCSPGPDTTYAAGPVPRSSPSSCQTCQTGWVPPSGRRTQSSPDLVAASWISRVTFTGAGGTSGRSSLTLEASHTAFSGHPDARIVVSSHGSGRCEPYIAGMADIILGLFAIIAGFVMIFAGQFVLRLVIPIWGFFAGFAFGAGLFAGLSDERFLGTVLGWVLGLVFALVFAVLAYLFYSVAIILAMAAFGFA